MSQNRESVGIAGIGIYIPHNRISSFEIAHKAGIPEEVLTEKIGMHRKPFADPGEQPSQMALRAARSALEKAGAQPGDLSIVIFCGAAPQDYLHWSAAGRLQHALGASNAFAFDISNGCNGLNVGMQVGKDLLLGNRSYSLALVASADKYSSFLDYTRKEDVSLFHVGDAAGAVVLRKNEPTNRLVSYFHITDGSYSDHVRINGGGTVNPCSSEKGCQRQTFSVKNPEELNKLLTEGYFKNYLTAIRKALEESGHTPDDIDFLFTNQVKASTMTAILEDLGVSQSKTCRSIADYGHMGTVDTLFALSQFLEEGKISAGDLVVLASSATGFSWAATVIQYLNQEVSGVQ